MLKNLIVKQVKKHLYYDQEEQRILKENYQKELNENNVDVKLTASAIGVYREVVSDIKGGWNGVSGYVDVLQRAFKIESFIPKIVKPNLSDIAVEAYKNVQFYSELYESMWQAKLKNQGEESEFDTYSTQGVLPPDFAISLAGTAGNLLEMYLPKQWEEDISDVLSSVFNVHNTLLARSLGYYLTDLEELTGDYYSEEMEYIVVERYQDLTVSFEEYIHDSMQEMTF